MRPSVVKIAMKHKPQKEITTQEHEQENETQAQAQTRFDSFLYRIHTVYSAPENKYSEGRVECEIEGAQHRTKLYGHMVERRNLSTCRCIELCVHGCVCE